MNRQDWAIAREVIHRQDQRRDVRVALNPMWPTNRTLADDLRENPKPVDQTPHTHFHGHGGVAHVHDHVHPEEHAHSLRLDLPAHEVTRA